MIWCVEDDASIRDIEVYALKSTGFEARGFEDGSSFFEALKDEIPRLVILDVMLPGDDGTQILKKMKENVKYADIPVIMATAKGNEYDKVQSLDLGADDYLVKPFSYNELMNRVKAEYATFLNICVHRKAIDIANACGRGIVRNALMGILFNRPVYRRHARGFCFHIFKKHHIAEKQQKKHKRGQIKRNRYFPKARTSDHKYPLYPSQGKK